MSGASEFSGQTALVTGGGSGLGEALCHTLANAGSNVIAADICLEGAERVADALREQGLLCRAIRLDVADERQAAEAVSGIIAAEGQLDVLVNNAGVDVTAPLEELPVDAWDHILAVNLRGPFLLSKHAFGGMKRRGRGHIVNIVSTAAKRAWPNASAYHASKWGLLGFSHALHAEARPHGVKVTAVISGGMRTPFLLDRFPDIDPNTLQDPRNVAETVRFVLAQPMESVIPEIMVLPMRETSWP